MVCAISSPICALALSEKEPDMTYISHLPPPAKAVGATLRIALLGPPTLMWRGQPFPIARRQARALLYRIAAATHPVPREQLGFLLWP